MRLHTFGDSHANSGWNAINPENLNTYLDIYLNSIGPKLCYSFGRDKLNLLNIKDFGVENGDIVVFCFGEIDLRCNIQKYITEENTYTNIIDKMIENYFIAISENVEQFDNLHVCVYNVVPTVKKSNTFEYPNHPFMGTDEERKTYVEYFNLKCNEYCQKYKYIFFNVYDKYCDSNGYLNKSYSDNNVHVLVPIYIEHFLYNLIEEIKSS